MGNEPTYFGTPLRKLRKGELIKIIEQLHGENIKLHEQKLKYEIESMELWIAIRKLRM